MLRRMCTTTKFLHPIRQRFLRFEARPFYHAQRYSAMQETSADVQESPLVVQYVGMAQYVLHHLRYKHIKQSLDSE